MGQFLDDAVERAELLLGQVSALEHVSDVAHHHRALVDMAQEAAIVELFLEMSEEVQEFGLGRGNS